jgi:hypothetical protein
MSVRKSKAASPRSAADPLQVHNPHAVGIDVHADVHWVAVPPGSAPAPPKNQPAHLPPWVRAFGTCTADLEILADWLGQCGVTTVAMEATGVYWIALFELLERRGFEVYLVDPRQSKRAPGRPNPNVLDCQWLQRLHSYGLLTASFRPRRGQVAVPARPTDVPETPSATSFPWTVQAAFMSCRKRLA